MRILLVSQMYPSPEKPELGIFVRDGADELERQGHVVERAVISQLGGSHLNYARLLARALAAARRFGPDVVYAHYLFPSGLIGVAAARAAGAPLVVTAHGRDVTNVAAIPGVRRATDAVVRRAATVIAVSGYLRDQLLAHFPSCAGRVEVIDSGVDVERFRGADPEEARARVGWDGGPPYYVCVGGLEARKNVVRLADAFARLGAGSLAFVGDGSLRPELEGRERVRLVGRVPHEEVATWVAASQVVCQPSLVEPFGQALLEAMASERSVVATRVGGPPEFVPPEAGVLVDPTSTDSVEEGLRAAAALPCPNPAAREAAARHDVRVQAARVAEVLERAARRARTAH